MIRPIERSAVQKICCGQVIVDLATAVKELVENSLDSGAKIVEIRLKNMGMDSIEVMDDGHGIHPNNYEGLAMKHYTSKLSEFSDLASVRSFGFRGEALNALCEISDNFMVSTKQCDQEVGAVLKYDRNGRMTSQSMAARSVGTTVIIEKLFDKLPVRRGEFIRSIKKHYQKMVKVIQAYAVIAVGVKMILLNVPPPSVGKQSQVQCVLNTQIGNSLSHNISTIFGSVFFSSLQQLHSEFTIEDNSKEVTSSIQSDGNVHLIDTIATDSSTVALSSSTTSTFGEHSVSNVTMMEEKVSDAVDENVCISGYISKAGVGVGRSDSDRQYCYCNGRPVDMSRVVKALNEVWRRYEMKHKPAFIIDIQLPRRFLDVNLTPDKREVAMMNETYILEKLREAVDALYAPSRFTLPANLIVDTLADTTPNQLQGRILQHFQPTFSADSSTSFISKPFLEDSMDKAEFEDSTPLTGSTEGVRDDLFTNSTAVTALRTPPSQSHTDLLHSDTDTPPGDFNSSSSNPILLQASSGGDMLNTGESKLNNRKSSWTFNAADSLRKYKHNRKKLIADSKSSSGSVSKDIVDIPNKSSLALRVLQKKDFEAMRVIGQFNLGFIIAKLNKEDLYILDQHACDEKYRFEELQRVTVVHQQPLIHPLTLETTAAQEMTILDHLHVFEDNGFKLRVINVDNSNHEDADCTSVSTGKRIQLLAVPFSKSVRFGPEDVCELASIIADSEGMSGNGDLYGGRDATGSKAYLLLKNDGVIYENGGTKRARTNGLDDCDSIERISSSEDPRRKKMQYRLPKLVAAFASRACRSAVMIGTALKLNDMQGIVKQMSGLDQPWNCPHGRPTIRHLSTLPNRECF